MFMEKSANWKDQKISIVRKAIVTVSGMIRYYVESDLMEPHRWCLSLCQEKRYILDVPTVSVGIEKISDVF